MPKSCLSLLYLRLFIPFPPKPFHDFLIPWSPLNSAVFAIIKDLQAQKHTSDDFAGEWHIPKTKLEGISALLAISKELFYFFASIMIWSLNLRFLFRHFSEEKDGSRLNILCSIREKIVIQRKPNVAFYLKIKLPQQHWPVGASTSLSFMNGCFKKLLELLSFLIAFVISTLEESPVDPAFSTNPKSRLF